MAGYIDGFVEDMFAAEDIVRLVEFMTPRAMQRWRIDSYPPTKYTTKRLLEDQVYTVVRQLGDMDARFAVRMYKTEDAFPPDNFTQIPTHTPFSGVAEILETLPADGRIILTGDIEYMSGGGNAMLGALFRGVDDHRVKGLVGIANYDDLQPVVRAYWERHVGAHQARQAIGATLERAARALTIDLDR